MLPSRKVYVLFSFILKYKYVIIIRGLWWNLSHFESNTRFKQLTQRNKKWKAGAENYIFLYSDKKLIFFESRMCKKDLAVHSIKGNEVKWIKIHKREEEKTSWIIYEYLRAWRDERFRSLMTWLFMIAKWHLENTAGMCHLKEASTVRCVCNTADVIVMLLLRHIHLFDLRCRKAFYTGTYCPWGEFIIKYVMCYNESECQLHTVTWSNGTWPFHYFTSLSLKCQSP